MFHLSKKLLCYGSFTAFFVSAGSAVLITLVERETNLLISNILSVIFWLAMIIGIIFCAMLAIKTKPEVKALPRPLHFFRNMPLKILDTVFMLSIMLTIIFSVCNINNAPVWSVLIFLNIFSIELHFLFSIKNKEESQK